MADIVKAMAMKQAADKVASADVAAEPETEETAKIKEHMAAHGAGSCSLCNEQCTKVDNPKLPDLRLARYTCKDASCGWLVCYFCAHGLEDAGQCEKCGDGTKDHQDEDEDEDEDEGEDEDEEDGEDEEEDEGEDGDGENETPDVGGRGGSGRGLGRGHRSGDKRERP